MRFTTGVTKAKIKVAMNDFFKDHSMWRIAYKVDYRLKDEQEYRPSSVDFRVCPFCEKIPCGIKNYAEVSTKRPGTSHKHKIVYLVCLDHFEDKQ